MLGGRCCVCVWFCVMRPSILIEGVEMTTTTFKSTAWVPPPLYGCLGAAEQFLGPNRVWRGITPEHERFLTHLAQGRRDLRLLSAKEYVSMASRQNTELNSLFERNGFDIRLP